MAETSEVKAGLYEIAHVIRSSSDMFKRSKTNIQTAYDQLNQIPIIYADVLATIDAYPGSDSFEVLCYDEKEKLTTEFIALKSLINALINTTEFQA